MGSGNKGAVERSKMSAKNRLRFCNLWSIALQDLIFGQGIVTFEV